MKCVLSYKDAALLCLSKFPGDRVLLGVAKFGSDYPEFQYFKEWSRMYLLGNECDWLGNGKVVDFILKDESQPF